MGGSLTPCKITKTTDNEKLNTPDAIIQTPRQIKTFYALMFVLICALYSLPPGLLNLFLQEEFREAGVYSFLLVNSVGIFVGFILLKLMGFPRNSPWATGKIKGRLPRNVTRPRHVLAWIGVVGIVGAYLSVITDLDIPFLQTMVARLILLLFNLVGWIGWSFPWVSWYWRDA